MQDDKSSGAFRIASKVKESTSLGGCSGPRSTLADALAGLEPGIPQGDRAARRQAAGNVPRSTHGGHPGAVAETKTHRSICTEETCS